MLVQLYCFSFVEPAHSIVHLNVCIHPLNVRDKFEPEAVSVVLLWIFQQKTFSPVTYYYPHSLNTGDTFASNCLLIALTMYFTVLWVPTSFKCQELNTYVLYFIFFLYYIYIFLEMKIWKWKEKSITLH